MKLFKAVCMLACITLLASGCTSYKQSLYLQNEQVLNESLDGQLYDFRVMPKDELTIIVSTTDPEASAPFYRKIGQSKEGGTSTTNLGKTSLVAYLVDNNGYIDFPVLGMIKVMGLTNRECEALLRQKLQPYLKEVPNVTVRTSNYKFSVLGEVGNPGTYTTDAEKVTVFEALAQAGDMTLFAVRNDVQLLREDSTGLRRVYHLDLTQADIAQSPYFYLQQNDVVYVKPTRAKVRSNTFNGNASIWITLLGLVTSVTSFILAISK
ncbi:polysaccharide biosynthesis/export family protein [Bacteroides mediterraneensis]|uniref:polysaccharide biosynthesis/export family protein n=1 Tax=Bacteroides mediterraneensis TaxID=1841856 RepID=UPI0026EC507F|nr:polysaccharide biosynthesis/export family protein [Bacteroides mediterraneensis]